MNNISTKINLSDEAHPQIEEQIRKIKERKKADRLRVVLYKAKGHSIKFIAKLLQLGRNQVSQILQRFNQGGVAALLQADAYQGSLAKLTAEQQQQLQVELKSKIYATAAQVIAWVEKQWGISYELSAIHKLLKRLGFSYKKNRLVPSQADPELQRQFVQSLAGLHQHIKPEDRLCFGDAVHFKHNAEAGFAWSERGHPHQIPANTGRQRYNVLGAYCLQTHKHLFILTPDNINQEKLVEFLALLRAKHPGRDQIYLIVDNAPYHHAQKVQAAARQQRIRLEYLPPYSPNLNPIERLWKLVRKKFFKDRYRETFAKFCTQLQDFFANLDQYQTELTTLLTENFELLPGGWQPPVCA
jgi:transposase